MPAQVYQSDNADEAHQREEQRERFLRVLFDAWGFHAKEIRAQLSHLH